MISFQADRMQSKLIQMGFSPRLVETLPPWSLLSNYNHQLMRKERLKLSETQNEWSESPETFSGAKAPYRLQVIK